MREVATPALPTLNLLDRAIAYVAPGLALRRQKSRGMMALGGYFGPGGRRGRPNLQNWNPGGGDANADISPDLADLRAYSRDLARRSPLAGGAISTVVTNVIGTGLALQPKPNAAFLRMSEAQSVAWQAQVMHEWKQWAETQACDITRTQNFYGLQSLAFRSCLESGDVPVLTPMVPFAGSHYELSVQVIEADRLCNPGRSADRPGLVQGVETDANGAPLRYYIARQHPGAMQRSGNVWDPYTAFGADGRRNVIHLFDRRRPGQVRGVPYLAAVIEPLKQLDRWTDAELSAAVLSAAFAVFVKMDPDAFGDLFTDDSRQSVIDRGLAWNGNLGSTATTLDNAGKVVNLLPGEDVVAPDLNRPNAQFDPFFLAIVRQIGVGLEIPFEVLIKHYTASYSAARAALLEAWRFFFGRRDFMATNFCQPIYELWLAEAVAIGRIAAPGFFVDPAYRHAWCGAVWTGDGPGSIDPLKEVDAASARIAAGISTIEREALLHDGIDWKTKLEQRAREVKARRDAGLEVAAPSAAAPGNYPSDPPPTN